MDKFQQISTELWLLIDVINCFSLSILDISLPIFFKLCMSSFKMIFFALKISHGGICCMHAALLFSKLIFHSGISSECQLVWIQIRPDIMSGLIWVQTVLQRLSADKTKELNEQPNNVRDSKYKIYS